MQLLYEYAANAVHCRGISVSVLILTGKETIVHNARFIYERFGAWGIAVILMLTLVILVAGVSLLFLM